MAEMAENLKEKAAEAVDAVRGDGESSPLARTAAAAGGAAIAGGIAALLKSALERRGGDEDEPRGEQEEPDEPEEPQAEQEQEQEQEPEEPQAGQEPQAEDEQDEPEQPDARREQDDDEPEQEDGADEQDGQQLAVDLRRAIRTARRQLEELAGTEVESVSGFEQTDDGLRVSLEVVEVRRIPDSTDVLCSYDVILDPENCSVTSLSRTRRYRRSQVDDA